jgi:hypothetical protein
VRAERPQVWLLISTFGQPVGFELRVEDKAHALTLEEAAGHTDMEEWLTTRAVDPAHVATLVEALGKLQAIAGVLDKRTRPMEAVATATAEPAGSRDGW